MKKINLKSISEVLSDKEMKNVLGGSGGSGIYRCCCGMGSDVDCFYPPVTSSVEANNYVFDHCPGGIGGCFIP
jgi:natural product precursor